MTRQSSRSARALRIASYGAIVAFIAVFVYQCSPSAARDNGQWAQLTPEPGETIEDRIERQAWFARQKVPGTQQSCCGEADAYYADKIWMDAKGLVFAVITDERPDGPLGRPHIAPGTRILIPLERYKDTREDPNPTQHTIIFVRWYPNNNSSQGDWGVLCYLPNGGM